MKDPAYFVRVLNFHPPINLQTCNKNRLLVVKSRTFAFGANLGLAKYELLGAHHSTSCKNSCIMCLPCVVPFCRSVLSYLVLTLRLGSDLCFPFHPWGHCEAASPNVLQKETICFPGEKGFHEPHIKTWNNSVHCAMQCACHSDN